MLTIPIVSVPYGDLFYFYKMKKNEIIVAKLEFPSPMGIFFISISEYNCIGFLDIAGFRPLWGSFLFLFQEFRL